MRTALQIRSVIAFGWQVNQLGLLDGLKYRYIIPADIERSKLPALSLWTKGRVTGVNLTTGNAVADRVPGVLTSELSSEVKAGRYELTAQTYSEWWCVSAMLNGGQLPSVRSLSLGEGQSVTVEADTLLLVCKGEVTSGGIVAVAGETMRLEAGASLLAKEETLGMIFDRSRT